MTKVTNPDPTPNASTPKPVFDLATLDTKRASDEGAEIELVHPVTKEPIDIFIGILGKHSEVFRETMKARVDKRIKRDAMAQRRGKPAELPTAEQVEEQATDLLVLCTTHWRSGNEKFIRLGGEDLEFNVANARRVYTQMLWVREQVDEAIGDLENFIKG